MRDRLVGCRTPNDLRMDVRLVHFADSPCSMSIWECESADGERWNVGRHWRSLYPCLHLAFGLNGSSNRTRIVTSEPTILWSIVWSDIRARMNWLAVLYSSGNISNISNNSKQLFIRFSNNDSIHGLSWHRGASAVSLGYGGWTTIPGTVCSVIAFQVTPRDTTACCMSV